MKLNKTPNPLNREARNKENENWDKIERNFNNVVEEVSGRAFDKVIDGSKIDWSQMVDDIGELPSNASEGETRGVKSDNKIYRFNGADWVPIAEINLNPIAEVDQRLTTQLAETDDKLNVQGWELNSKSRQKNGITVFTSDDGRVEEYTVAKDIFESEGVPQTIYLVSTWLNNPGMMTTEQALELQELGWEIGSHSRTHPSNPVMKDNPNSAFVEREFWESKRDLINMGFDVQNYAYPGGNYAKRERMFAKKHYRSARCSDTSFAGVNESPLNTYELKTIWLDPVAYKFRTLLEQNDRQTAIQLMFEYCKTTIDKAHDKNGIAIISTHFGNIDTEDLKTLFRQVIQYAKSKTEVTTMQEALNKMGNIVDIGDYSHIGSRAPGDTHFIIGADGIISGSATVTEPNRYSAHTPISFFPFGVTYTPINASNASGTPRNDAGVLVTYRLHDTLGGFNRQEFKHFGLATQQLSYVRFVKSDDTFTDWEADTGVFYDDLNRFDINTPFSEFNTGVTYSSISTSKAEESNLPDKRRGHLITYKLGGINQQEYRVTPPNEILSAQYFRNVTSSGVYGDWKLYTPGIKLVDDNNFDHTTNLNAFPVGITYSKVQGDNPNLSSAPEGKNGTLITHKVRGATGLEGYSFQEYHLNYDSSMAIYKRRATGQSSWGAFIKVTV